MNKTLMEHIARQILSSLGVMLLSSTDYSHVRSLLNKEFLLEQKLLFKNENNEVITNPIYGCQITVEQKDFKILLGDCSQDKSVSEFCVVVKFADNPGYGLYLVCDPSIDSEVIIAVTINNKDWMPCTTFLQATFLAAMEQLKDVGLGWTKCTDYQMHYEMLLSMIKFHVAYYEAEDEG